MFFIIITKDLTLSDDRGVQSPHWGSMKPFSGSVIGWLHHIFFLGATHFGENLFPPKQKHMKRTRAQPAPPQKKHPCLLLNIQPAPTPTVFFWGCKTSQETAFLLQGFCGHRFSCIDTSCPERQFAHHGDVEQHGGRKSQHLPAMFLLGGLSGGIWMSRDSEYQWPKSRFSYPPQIDAHLSCWIYKPLFTTIFSKKKLYIFSKFYV